MSNHSVIEHRANYFFVRLEDDYLAMYETINKEIESFHLAERRTSGPADCKAMIASVLEHWMNSKRAGATCEDDLYVYLTYEEWEHQLRYRYKRSVIIRCLNEMPMEGQVLDEQGEIQVGTIKRKPYVQNTYAYILNLKVVQGLLNELPEQSPYGARPRAILGRPRKNRVKINGIKLNGINSDDITEIPSENTSNYAKYRVKINERSIHRLPDTDLDETQIEGTGAFAPPARAEISSLQEKISDTAARLKALGKSEPAVPSAEDGWQASPLTDEPDDVEATVRRHPPFVKGLSDDGATDGALADPGTGYGPARNHATGVSPVRRLTAQETPRGEVGRGGGLSDAAGTAGDPQRAHDALRLSVHDGRAGAGADRSDSAVAAAPVAHSSDPRTGGATAPPPGNTALLSRSATVASESRAPGASVYKTRTVAAITQPPLSLKDDAPRPLSEKTLRARYEAHFWTLIEDVRQERGLHPPTYGKTWKALRDNQHGIDAFYADGVSDEAIRAGYIAMLESADTWLRNNFTVAAFFKRLQGLLDAKPAQGKQGKSKSATTAYDGQTDLETYGFGQNDEAQMEKFRKLGASAV